MQINQTPTPGPWVIETTDTGFQLIWEERMMNKGFSSPVARINNNEQRDILNAKLIAAAPDMKTALQKLIDVAVVVGVNPQHPAVLQAKQAIQKASICQ